MIFSGPYVVSILLAVWCIVLTFLLVRLMLHYQRLTGNVNKKDLITSLNQIIDQNRANHQDLQKLRADLEKEVIEGRKHIQRIGFKRFNPFTDTGGDQSFALSLLDENDNGIVVSSLHSRESTRIYAKQLIGGKPVNQVLSKEEADVIKKATEPLVTHAK